MCRLVLLTTILLLGSVPARAEPVTLMGANGREVAFAGVLEATPYGLVLLMKEGAEPMTVGWDKFDMPDLEERHRNIYEAGVDARSYSKTVPLHLGIYAEYNTYQQCLAKLAKAFDKPYEMSVPSYDDYVTYRRTYFYTMSSYENYAQDRREAFNDYRAFLGAFFKGKNIELDVSQSTYSANVYSAEPRQSTVKMTASDVIEYFAEENNRTRKEGMIYIQNNRDVLARPISLLRDMQQQAPNPLFDKTDPDEIYFSTLLENSIRDLEHLNTEKSFPHSALRNFEKLLNALNKGRASATGS